VPTGQAKQLAWSVLGRWPAGQTVQALAPGVDTEPTGQLWQMIDPVEAA